MTQQIESLLFAQRILVSSACFLLCVFASDLPVSAQKAALLTPETAPQSSAFAEKLEAALDERVDLLDSSLAEAAYASVSPETPFNLTAEEAKRIGATIGCNFFILTRFALQRRSAFRRAAYYEAYAVIYLVSSRTGMLALWKIQRFEDQRPEIATKMLDNSFPALAIEIATAMRDTENKEVTQPEPTQIEEVPDATSPSAKNFRAPIPYRRIKPEYTELAALYDVSATVEILVDTDSVGSITRTKIVRWAGFGLDESVDRTVRAMNWRPAERNGKPLPMRFLLRYNFKKVEKN